MAAIFLAVNLFAAVLANDATPVSSGPVSSGKTACALAKSRFIARDHFPASRIGSCEVLSPRDSPRGFYVLVLRSNRKCDGICSTLLGWFAVEKATGRVFDWDVAEDRPGVELRP